MYKKKDASVCTEGYEFTVHLFVDGQHGTGNYVSGAYYDDGETRVSSAWALRECCLTEAEVIHAAVEGEEWIDRKEVDEEPPTPTTPALQFGKVYHCTDDGKRLLLSEGSGGLTYALIDHRDGAWTTMPRSNRESLIAKFIDGTIDEAASELVREVF